MNEIYTGKSKTATLPPIQIQAPSMTSVLDMLNIINGILFVQINPRDIENLKNEFEKRQQTTTAGSASPPPDTEVVESKSISGEEENAEETKNDIKLVLLGESGSGKTSLIRAYHHNTFQEDDPAFIATTEVYQGI